MPTFFYMTEFPKILTRVLNRYLNIHSTATVYTTTKMRRNLHQSTDEQIIKMWNIGNIIQKC